MIGYCRTIAHWGRACLATIVAIALSATILFYGMRFAPPLRVNGDPAIARTFGSIFLKEMSWQTIHWIAGSLLALAWFSRIVEAAIGMPQIADVARPEWDRSPRYAERRASRQHCRSGSQ